VIRLRERKFIKFRTFENALAVIVTIVSRFFSSFSC